MRIHTKRTRRNSKKKYITKLKPGRSYGFKIRACTTKGPCGPWSDRVDSSTTTPNPVLKNLLVDFAPYDASTGMAGAFNFEQSVNDDKVFLEFGAEVENGDGDTKILPTFEYRVDDEAQVSKKDPVYVPYT